MAGSETITEIRAHGRGRKRRTVVVDGEPLITMPVDAVRELGLSVGDEIDVTEITERLHQVSSHLARERALRLMNYRERSAHELRERLSEDGYPAAVVESVVADLTASALIDDERFADNAARTLVVGRSLGRQRALLALERRGISREAAVEALDRHAPMEAETERANALARRLLRQGDTVERLAARLARRGFSSREALGAAREIVQTSGQADVDDFS